MYDFDLITVLNQWNKNGGCRNTISWIHYRGNQQSDPAPQMVKLLLNIFASTKFD